MRERCNILFIMIRIIYYTNNVCNAIIIIKIKHVLQKKYLFTRAYIRIRTYIEEDLSHQSGVYVYIKKIIYIILNTKIFIIIKYFKVYIYIY